MKRHRAAIAVTLLLVVSMLSGVAGVTAQSEPERRSTLPWDWSLGSYRQTGVVVVGDHKVAVEISNTPELRERGLSYHAGLATDSGMLFVYDDSGRRIYWMKGMGFCLDIVWIDQGEIVGAAESVCPEPGVSDADLGRYASPDPVQYVLELPAGWLNAHGYGAGTPVTIPNLS